MNISIKKLQPIHSESYRKLRLESLKKFPTSFCSTYEEQKLKRKLSFEAFIEERNVAKLVVGAFDDEKLIGICAFCQENEKEGELIQMYVQSAYHGKKIGKRLVQTVIDIAFQELNLKRIHLGVFSSSLAAFYLYQKLGFEKTELKKEFLEVKGKKFDLILMEILKS